LHVLDGLWARIDVLGMILACNMNEMVGYECGYGIGMYNDFLCWLEKHDFGMVMT